MRKIVVHMQSTLDNRIANAQGTFWEPFPWGETEVAYLNQFFRAADTLAQSRVMYDVVVPWWDGVATGQLPADAPQITPTFADFAQLQHRMTKVVFSNTMEPADGRVVLRGDLAGQLTKLKQQDGADIILACGPATLGPLASTPGLVDEYLIAVHPRGGCRSKALLVSPGLRRRWWSQTTRGQSSVQLRTARRRTHLLRGGRRGRAARAPTPGTSGLAGL